MTRPQRTDHDSDYDRYWTPSWATRLLLESIDLDAWGPTVAEPCAGEGAIVEVLEEEGLSVTASDLHPETPYRTLDARSGDARRWHCWEDEYTSTAPHAPADSVIVNPPYSCDHGTAESVLDALLDWSVPVAALLRESFVEPCSDRHAWYCADGPSERRPDRIIVLPRVEYHGPGVDDDAGGNGETSAWWIWHPGPVAQSETTIEWRGKHDRDEARGQTTLLGE